MSAQPEKRLESLGDAVWRLVVVEKIFRDHDIPRSMQDVWNTNKFMAQCGTELGMFPKHQGCYFERFVAQTYLAGGLEAVRLLVNRFCKPGQDHPF